MRYDYAALRSTANAGESRPIKGIGRFDALLPYAVRDLVPLCVGDTPLHAVGLVDDCPLFLKDESGQPSGSLKDRATLSVLAAARARGAGCVAVASTGNAAASTACLAASAGLRAVVFVPASVPSGKLAQMRMYGASVALVQGGYDDAVRLCGQVCRETGWFERTTATNPFTREGKKTVVLELVEQLGGVPDWIMVPTGDGNILTAVFQGLRDLFQLGRITRLPRLVAAQARGSASIARAFERVRAGGRMQILPAEGTSRADSIAVKLPADGAGAVHALCETQGAAVVLEDAAILSAVELTARRWGVFVEPAAASAVAAFSQLRHAQIIAPGESVVCLLTGAGLKDASSALAHARAPYLLPAEPDITAVIHALERT